MPGKILEKSDYKLEKWLSQSYNIVSTGFNICKISVVFVFLAYTLNEAFTSSSSIFGIYSEIPSAVKEGAVPLSLTAVFIIVDNIKRNIPKKPSKFRYIDFVFGLFLVIVGGILYYRLFNYYENSVPENMIVYLPWAMFFTGLLTINTGVVVNGLSRLFAQPVYILSNNYSLREEASVVSKAVRVSADILSNIKRIARENDENYPHTIKRIIIGGIESIDGDGFVESKDTEEMAKRSAVSNKRLISSHKNMIVAYLFAMTASLVGLWVDIEYEYAYLITVVLLFLVLTTPLGVISGIFRDSDYVTYVSYEWNVEPIFYLISCAVLQVLSFVSIIIASILHPDVTNNTTKYILVGYCLGVAFPAFHYLYSRRAHFKEFKRR